MFLQNMIEITVKVVEALISKEKYLTKYYKDGEIQ